jgi:CRISPR-associated protein Cas1
MPNLYLTEQGAVVRKRSDRLVVEKEGKVLLEVSCLKLEAVLIYGNVQVTTQALAELLDHGIELAFLSHSGRLRGQLTPPKARNVPLRFKQYELAHATAFCLELAREIVGAKIESSVAVLKRFRSNHPEALPVAEVAESEGAVESARRAITLEALRGVEGSAAARYFGAFRAMVPPAYEFDGRNRRPPRDPVNALLSLGYVLLGNELSSLLDGMGFDPYVGFYHQIDYGRPSLALDLLEEFRAALVDRWSAGLLNLRLLQKADFQITPNDGVRLTHEALKRYFAAYEEEMERTFEVEGQEVSFRDLFRRQAERLARALVQGEVYRSFRLPC